VQKVAESGETRCFPYGVGRVEQSFLRLFFSSGCYFLTERCENPGVSPRVVRILTIVCEKCIMGEIHPFLTFIGEIESYRDQESLFETVIPGYS